MKIGYSKTYPIISNGQWEKIWLEDEITGSEEDVRKFLFSLKKQVENFHYESNKSDEKRAAVNQGAVENPIEKMISGIANCKDEIELFTFKKLADNYPDIKSVYEKKLKELTQQTNNQ